MNQRPSRAGECFKSIIEAPNPADFLANLINTKPPTSEEAWLDFKSGRLPDPQLKEKWSKALGAMANTEGGVVVWGIYAAKDPTTKIDAAKEIQSVQDIGAFTTRLKELQRVLTDPPVPGVEIKSFVTSGNEGFVVCFIPPSSFKPHRSEAADRRFYVRIQDHSEEVSVTWLRRLFQPEIAPDFDLRVQVRTAPIQFGSTKQTNFSVTIQNRGSGTAYDPILEVKEIPDCLTGPNAPAWGLIAGYIGFGRAYIGPKIHPGARSQVMGGQRTFDGAPITLTFRVLAKDMPPVAGAIQLEPSDQDPGKEIPVDLSPIGY